MDYGKRIRAAREARGWTQFDLGVAIGHRDSDVSRWERNVLAPKVSTMVNIAAALGVPLDYLCGVTDTMTLSPEWLDVRNATPERQLQRLPTAPQEPQPGNSPAPPERE